MPKVSRVAVAKHRDRKMSTKWKSLKARGFTPPKDREENRKRAHEAHHGVGSYQGGK